MNALRKEEQAENRSQSRALAQHKKRKHKRNNQGQQEKPIDAPVIAPAEESKLVTITDEEISVKWGGAESALAPADRNEVLEDLKNIKQEGQALKSAIVKMQEEIVSLQEQAKATAENAVQQAEALKGDRSEIERQRLYGEGRMQELEKRLAILEKPKALAAAYEAKIDLPASALDKKSIGGSLPPALLESPAAHALQQKLQRKERQAAPVGPAASPVAPPNNGHVPHLRKLEISKADATGPRQVRAGRSFGLRLTLDLEAVNKFGTAPMAYEAIVYAKSLSSNLGEILVEAHDHITPTGIVTLNLIAKPLLAGAYRLHATVTLAMTKGEHSTCTASLDGGLMFAN